MSGKKKKTLLHAAIHVPFLNLKTKTNKHKSFKANYVEDPKIYITLDMFHILNNSKLRNIILRF